MSSLNKKTDLGIPQFGALNVTLLLVKINGILKELKNGVVGSFFVANLAIYNTKRNQKMVTRALQRVTNKLR